MRPVANWSRLVLPTKIAPASSRRRTTVAVASGLYAKAGHAAVVGRPATSMLSLIANGTPKSDGRASGSHRSSIAAARACSAAASKREIQTPSPPRAARRSRTASTTAWAESPRA